MLPRASSRTLFRAEENRRLTPDQVDEKLREAMNRMDVACEYVHVSVFAFVCAHARVYFVFFFSCARREKMQEKLREVFFMKRYIM